MLHLLTAHPYLVTAALLALCALGVVLLAITAPLVDEQEYNRARLADTTRWAARTREQRRGGVR